MGLQALNSKRPSPVGWTPSILIQPLWSKPKLLVIISLMNEVLYERRLAASVQSDRERNWWTSNIERPISNVEWMYSVYFKKDFAKPPARKGSNAYASESDSILRNSIFVIRYSAVRCLIRVIQATILIIKKPCHFGVVSYERRRVPSYKLATF